MFAGDASSLFRVISEHIMDIQKYHYKLRQDIALFMQYHFRDYANEVSRNFQGYILNLKRYRTHGTLLELRALADYYKYVDIIFVKI